jgi:hypothetical protein
VRSGTIVLLRDGRHDRSAVVRLLPNLIDLLRSDGFRMVTVDELLADGVVRAETRGAERRRLRSYRRAGFVPRTALSDFGCRA